MKTSKINAYPVSRSKCKFGLLMLVQCFLLAGSAHAQALPERPMPKAKFLITAVSGNDDKEKDTFRVGERILIRTLLVNESSAPLPMLAINPLWQYRFMLTKSGKPGAVPFRSDRVNLLSSTENDWGAGAVLWRPPLEPGKSKELMTINLNEIFDPLEPGKYKLTVFYRVGGAFGKTKLPSSNIIFRII